MPRFINCLTIALLLVGWEIVRGDDGRDANPSQRVIEGRVVDAAAAPVAGASVVLRADDDVIQPNGVIARTDADGRYSADVSKHEWATSKIRCRALARGFAYATGSLEAGSGPATVDFALKAEPWKTTEIRLADPAGRPGAGVAVSCLIDDLPWQTLKTDGAGLCVVSMAIGQAIELVVKPEASRPIRATLLNTKDAPAKVVLPILGPIAGRIHDKAGRPLTGIAVGRMIDEGEKGPEVYPHFFSETVTTGPDGKFAYAPTVMLKDRDLEGRPDRKPLPASICFADQSCARVAFGMVDLAGPVEPLDITLEQARGVRIPIELDTVGASADASGFLTVFLQPRRDMPEFLVPVLSRHLTAQNLTGSGHVVVGLPAGEYVVHADCFTKDYKRIGKAERRLVVPPGEGPIDSPAMRVEASLQQKMAGKPAPRSTQPTSIPASPPTWRTSAARWWCSTSGDTGAVLARARCRTWLHCTASLRAGPSRWWRFTTSRCSHVPIMTGGSLSRARPSGTARTFHFASCSTGPTQTSRPTVIRRGRASRASVTASSAFRHSS